MNRVKKSWHNSPANKTVLPDIVSRKIAAELAGKNWSQTWHRKYPKCSFGKSLDILNARGDLPAGGDEALAKRMDQAIKTKDVWAVYELGTEIERLRLEKYRREVREVHRVLIRNKARLARRNRERGHTPEEKDKAVAAWQQQQEQFPERKARRIDGDIAKRFGVSDRTIRDWRKELV